MSRTGTRILLKRQQKKPTYGTHSVHYANYSVIKLDQQTHMWLLTCPSKWGIVFTKHSIDLIYITISDTSYCYYNHDKTPGYQSYMDIQNSLIQLNIPLLHHYLSNIDISSLVKM